MLPSWFHVVFLLPLLASLGATHPAHAQGDPTSVEHLKALLLPQLPGAVPTFYSPGSEDQARRFQAALTPYVVWLGGELHTRLPITLAVLDSFDWPRATHVPYPQPHAGAHSSVIVLPSTIRNYRAAAPGEDADFRLELISLYQAALLYLGAVHLETGSLFLNELFSNCAVMPYLRDHRPDLKSLALAPPAAVIKARYTSFADMDILGDALEGTDYDWFESKIAILSVPLTQSERTADLIAQLERAFPPRSGPSPNLPPFPESIARLEAIHPGFRATAGDLAGPSSLATLRPSACSAAPDLGAAFTRVVIRNLTGHAVTIKGSDGQDHEIQPGERVVPARVGEQVTLPSGQCVTAVANAAVIDLSGPDAGTGRSAPAAGGDASRPAPPLPSH